MDGFRRRIQSESLVGQAHLLGEGGVGFPGGGMAGVNFFHHLVYLLEGETFRFGLKGDMSACANVTGKSEVGRTYDEEVGKGRREAAEGTPEEEDLGTQICVTLVGTD